MRAASRAGRQAEVEAGPLLGQGALSPWPPTCVLLPGGSVPSRPGAGQRRPRHTGAGFNSPGHALRCLRNPCKRNIRRSARRSLVGLWTMATNGTGQSARTCTGVWFVLRWSRRADWVRLWLLAVSMDGCTGKAGEHPMSSQKCGAATSGSRRRTCLRSPRLCVIMEPHGEAIPERDDTRLEEKAVKKKATRRK